MVPAGRVRSNPETFRRMRAGHSTRSMKAIVWEATVGYVLMGVMLAGALMTEEILMSRMLAAMSIVVWAVATHQMQGQKQSGHEGK